MDYRVQLLEGKLPLPAKQKIKDIFPKKAEQINRMWNALWYNFLQDEGSINGPLWADRIGHSVFNTLLISMSNKGWLIANTIPARNWSEIKLNKDKLLNYVTSDELITIRAQHKYDKYLMDLEPSNAAKVTSLKGKLTDTGLVRNGFKKAGNTVFSYDMEMLSAEKEAVLLELNKSMDKIRKDYPKMRADAATYDQVCTAIYDWHEDNPYERFTTGMNINDSRGRAISQCLKKVANPISSKNFRASLIIPTEFRNKATIEGANAIFLFVAELIGFKSGTANDKLNFGKECWFNHKLVPTNLYTNKLTQEVFEQLVAPDEWYGLVYSKDSPQGRCWPYEDAIRLYIRYLPKFKDKLLEREADRAESNRKDHHENIWLTRLYEELNSFYMVDIDSDYMLRKLAELMGDINPDHYWSTPIELDASASMQQYIGALLGESRLLESTNCTTNNGLSDPWDYEGIPRNQFKTAATPLLYGSSQTCQSLWAKAGIKFTPEQVKLFHKELVSGGLGVANMFKEFIIRNCNPSETMKLHIWDEEFLVQCNRYRTVGEEFHAYSIYDTNDKSIKDIIHMKTKQVADLDQFRRYFVTGLIHNLDSQVADYVTGKIMDLYNWCIAIHDAFITCPEAAATTRQLYSNKLTEIYNNRETILLNYFRSIGITNAAIQQWQNLMSKVQPVENFVCDSMALK